MTNDPAGDEACPPAGGPWTEIRRGSHPVVGRTFTDGKETWNVIEITPEYLAGVGVDVRALKPELRHGWLSFECGELRRRCTPIPPNWHDMSPEELRQLCTTAVPHRFFVDDSDMSTG